MERAAGKAASWRRPAPGHSYTRDNGWESPCRTPSGRSAGNRWCPDRTSLRRSPRPFRWTSWLADWVAGWPETGQWSNEPNRPTHERARANAYAKKTLNFTLDSKCNKKLFYKKNSFMTRTQVKEKSFVGYAQHQNKLALPIKWAKMILWCGPKMARDNAMIAARRKGNDTGSNQ